MEIFIGIMANFFQICSPSGSEALHKETKSTDKTLKVILHGFYHCQVSNWFHSSKSFLLSDGRRGIAQSLCWERTNQKWGHQGHGGLGGGKNMRNGICYVQIFCLFANILLCANTQSKRNNENHHVMLIKGKNPDCSKSKSHPVSK